MSTNPKIKVLIADDHPVVRQALGAILESFDEFDVVALADNGQTALTMCHHYQPDVVLMDLQMPVMSGLEAIQIILANHPQMKIIVLSSSIDDALIQEALQAGAMSFLSKTGTVDEVAEAVQRAYHGQPYLDAYGIKALMSIQTSTPHIGYDLTRRQRDVLRLMAQGLNNSEIAEQLFVSKSTIKNHVMSIFAKLHVESRSQAVAVALRNHILGGVALERVAVHSTGGTKTA